MPITFTNYQLDLSEFETNLLKILFFTVPAMILLWRAVHGWRLGLTRKITVLLSMLGGVASAYWFGSHASSFLPKELIDYPLARQIVGGLLAALIAYCCLRLLFAIALRASSTNTEGSGNKFAGSLLGLAEGLLLVFLLVLIIRWTSEISEAWALSRSPEGVSPETVLEEETQAPLPGANVILVGTRRGAVTDKAGVYKIKRVPPGEYTGAPKFWFNR